MTTSRCSFPWLTASFLPNLCGRFQARFQACGKQPLCVDVHGLKTCLETQGLRADEFLSLQGRLDRYGTCLVSFFLLLCIGTCNFSIGLSTIQLFANLSLYAKNCVQKPSQVHFVSFLHAEWPGTTPGLQFAVSVEALKTLILPG